MNSCFSALGTFDDSLCEGGHKCLADAKLAALADSAADQTAQNIAAALIGGHDSVGDHECCGTDVVGDDTDRDVGLMVFAVLAVSQLTDLVAQGADCVDIKEGLDILHCDSQTLQAHAGIDVFLYELGVIAVSVIVELGKDDVPDFHVAVAFAAHDVLGTVAPLLAAVI